MYNKSCKARGRSVLNYAQFLYFVFWKMLINFLCVYFLSFVLCLQMVYEKSIIFLTII